MRLWKRMIGAFLAVCMVISMIPGMAVTADASADAAAGRIVLDGTSLSGQSFVWVDGVGYPVTESGGSRYVALPDGAEPSSVVTYSYHVGDPGDIHTQYPVGMQVWALNRNADGSFIPEKVEALSNILQYSGSSIRITGNKGIRMITSMEQSKKNDLTSGGLAGYQLLEYGTVLSWTSDLAGGDSLVLGRDYARSNYAYKKDVADPVFAYSGNLMQYTNVLVGFTMDQCADDIAMRPYMILEKPDGSQMTIYGGTVHRSIGYIAWQNRNAFTPGSAAYEYVWEIIRHVYAEISFETNGGSPVESIFVEKGAQAQMPEAPEKEGYVFAGWYTDEALTEEFDFETVINEGLTLYAKWTTGNSDRPTMPENPSKADEYYFSTSDVIKVLKATESESVPTEADVVKILTERGFSGYSVICQYAMDGSFDGKTNASRNSASKHPMYLIYYITGNMQAFTVYVINGDVFAYPVSFSWEAGRKILLSESTTLTCYDAETNKFYVTVPHEDNLTLKQINRIDAQTLENLTYEEVAG